MNTFTETLAPNGAVLTGYLQAESRELVNAQMRPAVLVFPGGGYQMCSDREAEPVALAYMAEGYNAFVLRYTVGSNATFEQAYADAEAALGYLRENAQALHIDAEKITVAGFSAGGHLAACLGTMGGKKPAALVLGYPCIKSSMGRGLGKSLPGADEAVNSETPPTFLFSTQGDALVPIENTLDFASALAKSKVPFEQHIFLTGGHGLSLSRSFTSSGAGRNMDADVAAWFGLSIRFLQNIWGDFSVNHEDVPAANASTSHESVLDWPLGVLMENEQVTLLLEAVLPGFSSQGGMVSTLSIRRLASYAKGALTAETLSELEAKIDTLVRPHP